MSLLEKTNWVVAVIILLFIATYPEIIHFYKIDKIQHAAISSVMIIALVEFLSVPIIISTVIVFIVGVIKETTDNLGLTGYSGIFSYQDLMADVIGILLATTALIFIGKHIFLPIKTNNS